VQSGTEIKAQPIFGGWAELDVTLVAYLYRCSDVELDRLMRRQDGRDGEAGESVGARLNRALLALCDEVEHSTESGLFIESSEATEMPEAIQRKVRLPKETVDRVKSVVAKLPGVSRDRYTREAIRRAVKAF
jgi:hypothetical protein